MILKQLKLYTLFTIFTLTCYQSLAFAAGATAMTGLAQAQEVAARWKPDAILVQILTLTGKADGTAEKWTYVFHSPAAKRGFQVALRNGKFTELEVSASFTDALEPGFIDSSQAAAEAIKNKLVVKNDLMMMLHVMQKNTKNEAGYWNILGDMTAEMSILINARTGKFYKEHKFQ